MNIGIAVLLVSIVAFLQSPDLSIYGDHRIIPRERIGEISMWSSPDGRQIGTRQDIISRLGNPDPIQGVPGWGWSQLTWENPRIKLQRWHRYGLSLGFCTTGALLSVVIAASSFSEYNAGEIWRNVRSLITPEGKTLGRDQVESFRQTYGKPARTLYLVDTDPIDIYENGIITVYSRADRFLYGIGTYNADVCDGKGKPEGSYIPYLMEWAQVKPVFFSKTGDESKGVIGSAIPSSQYGISEWIHAGVRFSVKPKAGLRRLPYERRFISEDGRVASNKLTAVIPAGESEVTLVATLGLVFQRIPGVWKVEFVIGNMPPIATETFTIKQVQAQ